MMKIYKEEKDLADQINNSNSFSYYLRPEVPSEQEAEVILASIGSFAKADIKDRDLFYHKSILVTTNWNENDDVFVPAELWAARNSPIHKPTNLNHQSSKIVGHMTGNWSIDAEGNLIDDDTAVDELPTKFHILNGAVIYRKYHNDPDHEQAVAQLIDDISEGKQFVSMECGFSDFDYALKMDSGEIKILPRNEASAFLTKHLRAYGGRGVYEGAKVGRVLKNITFIGKGYTPKPANKESLIFTESDIFDFANASFSEKITETKGNCVVSSNKKGVKMAESTESKPESRASAVDAELKQENKALADQIAELQEKLAKADVQKYIDQAEAMQSANDELTKLMAQKDEKIAEMTKLLDASASDVATLKKDAESVKAELAEIKRQKTVAERTSYLIDGQVDKAVAEAKVEMFSALSDDQFKAVADEIIKATQASADYGNDMKKKEKEAQKKKQEEADAASEADLDASEPDESDDATASETDNTEDSKVVQITSLAEKLKIQFNRGEK